LVLRLELSLLISPVEKPSSSGSSNDGERIVATFVYVDDRILFVVVASNAAEVDEVGLRRLRVFDGSFIKQNQIFK
jgi:hypothetical protein